MTEFRTLTDSEWAQIKPVVQPEEEKKPSRGRTPTDLRQVVNSMLYVIEGMKWSTIPQEPEKNKKERTYAPFATAFRGCEKLRKTGKLEKVFNILGIKKEQVQFPPTRTRHPKQKSHLKPMPPVAQEGA